jgi:hypothetical protein
MLTVIAEIICHSEQDFKTVLDSFNNIREQVLQEPVAISMMCISTILLLRVHYKPKYRFQS